MMIRLGSALAAFALVALLPEAAEAQRKPDLITLEEIAERTDINTAFDAVRRLRPAFLRGRPSGSMRLDPDPIWVYVDGMKAGGPEALENIQIAQVFEIRKLSATDATTRFGTNHTNGAILIKTVRNQPPPDRR